LKLAIATAFRSMSEAFEPYIEALYPTIKVLTKAGIDSEPLPWVGASYPHHAKNALLALFLKRDFTDVLIIDSDMWWDIEGLTRILQAPVDCVGGTYPTKNAWDQFCASIILDKDGFPANVDPETGLIEAHWVPGGFLRLTRRCVERMFDAYQMHAYKEGELDCVQLFAPCVDPGAFQTEDVTFCQRWRDLGEKVWLEPRITFKHIGDHAWTGNYHDYLTRLPGGCNEGA